MSTDERSVDLDRKIKMVGLPLDEFITKYQFVSKRTLRGYLLEVVNFIFSTGILCLLLYSCVSNFLEGDYIYSFVFLVSYIYAMSFTSLLRKDIYLLNYAEFYIDIRRRK